MASNLTKSVESSNIKPAKKQRKASKTTSNASAAATAQTVKPVAQDAMTEAAIAMARSQGANAKQAYQEELGQQWDEFLAFSADFLGAQSGQFIGAVEEYYGVSAIAAKEGNGIDLIEGGESGQLD